MFILSNCIFSMNKHYSSTNSSIESLHKNLVTPYVLFHDVTIFQYRWKVKFIAKHKNKCIYLVGMYKISDFPSASEP